MSDAEQEKWIETLEGIFVAGFAANPGYFPPILAQMEATASSTAQMSNTARMKKRVYEEVASRGGPQALADLKAAVGSYNAKKTLQQIFHPNKP